MGAMKCTCPASLLIVLLVSTAASCHGQSPLFSQSNGSNYSTSAPQGNIGAGPGGSLTADPIADINVTPASFVVNQCGVVAPHTHANSAEVNFVIAGYGQVCDQPTQLSSSNQSPLICSHVSPGDSFIFPIGTYHHWFNGNTTQLVTVTSFPTAAPPDAALMAVSPTGSNNIENCEPAGVVGQTIQQGGGELSDPEGPASPMVKRLIGDFGAAPGNPGFPLFPQLSNSGGFSSPSPCQSAINSAQSLDTSSGDGTLKAATQLASPSELASGVYNVGSNNIGGAVRLLSGSDWDWLGDADMTMGLYVFSYCGMLNMHLHTGANEWGTCISGGGYVFQYPANSPGNLTVQYVTAGDTFYIPMGNVHWFVNAEPSEQWITLEGWSESALELSFLTEYINQVNQGQPDIIEAVLGSNFKPTTAPTLAWPLLEGAAPSGCGGDKPCNTCGDVDFLNGFTGGASGSSN